MHRRLITLAAVLFACSNGPSGSSNDAGAPTSDAASASSPLDDGQIVGVLHALYEGESDEGRVVANSAARAEIVSFADQVVTDDSSADAALTRDAASESIAPSDSPASAGLRGNTAQELATLKSETGSALAVSFVSFAAARERGALAILDRLLSRYASNPQLRARVASAREIVTDHLAHANALAIALAR